MYNVGDLLYSRSNLSGLTFFFIVREKFKNYFGDIVYVLESFDDESSYNYKKFNELEKFMDGWMHRAEGVDLV